MSLKQELVNLEGQVQKFDSLKAREKELTEQIRELEQKKADSDRTLIPIEGKIKNAEDKRRRTKASGVEKYNTANKRLEGPKKYIDSIERVTRDLTKLASMDLDSQMEHYENLLKRSEEDKVKQVTQFFYILSFYAYFLK